jgi:glutathione peroxidase
MSTGKRKYSKLKKFFIVLGILSIAFFAYVEIANINSKHMTYRQKILKAVYPAFMWWNKVTGKNRKTMTNNIQPPVSFYTLTGTAINGTPIDLSQYKGKKILLVNTASDCGYTNQYADLEKLYQQYKDSLVIIGFPANDFKEQEKGDNETIAEFCKVNYGVTFPLMQKSSVIKSAAQNPIFQWLTDPKQNGWNAQEPTWNFCKYLVDENGKLINFFASSVEPLSDEVISALKK